jgi:hypothetical protein
MRHVAPAQAKVPGHTGIVRGVGEKHREIHNEAHEEKREGDEPDQVAEEPGAGGRVHAFPFVEIDAQVLDGPVLVNRVARLEGGDQEEGRDHGWEGGREVGRKGGREGKYPNEAGA